MPQHNTEYIRDRIRRAYEMEEVMDGLLIELCRVESVSGISDEIRKHCASTLNQIKQDTVRHKTVLDEVSKKLADG